MANAAHVAVFAHATTIDGTYTEMAGINDANMSFDGDTLDATAYSDSTAFRSFIAGLRSATVDASGDYLASNAQQAALRTGFINGTTVFAKVLMDGTNGYKGEFIVKNFRIGGGVADKATFSASLQLTGAPTAVP